MTDYHISDINGDLSIFNDEISKLDIDFDNDKVILTGRLFSCTETDLEMLYITYYSWVLVEPYDYSKDELNKMHTHVLKRLSELKS